MPPASPAALKSKPSDSWPAWTDRPIPFRLVRDSRVNRATDAEHRREIDRHARQRGGMTQLVGNAAD